MDELSSEVISRAGAWAAEPVLPNFGGTAPRWRQFLPLAAFSGLLCFGPDHGRRVPLRLTRGGP